MTAGTNQKPKPWRSDNLRPVGDPRVSAAALKAMVDAVREHIRPGERGGAMSALRRAIMECIARGHPHAPSLAELRRATGVSNAVLKEHIRALRWKGLIMFEALTLSPSALAEFRPAPLAGPMKLEDCPATIRQLCGPIEARIPLPDAAEPVVDNKMIGAAVHVFVQPSRQCGKTAARDWIAERRARLDAAIGFLKSKAILVSVINRQALIRTYRISGKRLPRYAEGVIEHAQDLGWEHRDAD